MASETVPGSRFDMSGESGDDGNGMEPQTTRDSKPEASHERLKLRRRKTKLPSDAHKVTFTITVAKAIPTPSDEEMPDVEDMVKKRKKVVEAPRAQSYYHTEYQLLPSENEPMKTDVVTFGMAAKVYSDKQEPKVVKTWQEGERTWIAWTHNHTVQVTADLLKKLHQHTLQLRIWDTKDKCSTRAKFDRPKTFRLPPSKDADDANGVRAVVLQQAQAFVDTQPKQSSIERPLPAETPSVYAQSPELPAESRPASVKRASRGSRASDRPVPADPAVPALPAEPPAPAPARRVSPTPNTLVSIPNRGSSAADPSRTYSRLGHLAGMTPPTETKPKSGSNRTSKPSQKPAPAPLPAPPAGNAARKTPEQKRAAPPARQETLAAPPVAEQQTRKSVDAGSPAHSPGGPGPVVDPTQTKKSKKNDPAAQLLAEHVKKHGVAVIPIRMAEFYAGRKSLTSRLETPVPSLEDLFITVSIDEPLISPEQLKMLNPLIFTIQTIGHMPSTPLSYQQLTQMCHPVTCQYKLFKQPTFYKSTGRRHGQHIHMNDTYVFLLGTMDDESLREYLTGPLLEIELHDRDRKPVDEKLEPALFGDELEDGKLSNVGVIASRRTTNNPFTDRGKHWDPYGLAKFELTGLLRGERLLQCNIPVQPCNMPDVLGGDTGQGKLFGLPGAVDGPADPPLPAGDYLSSGTTLKLRVDLALGLNINGERGASATRLDAKCPFGRIVIIFGHSHTSFLTDVHALATSINAAALGLVDMADHVRQLALATYKLSRDQQTSRTLDLLTGFHLMDGVRHIIMLEGLLSGALLRFWRELPQNGPEDLRVYYNADLTFGSRIYQTLDVDLTKIKLHEPLDNIVQRSLLYVRDIVPKPCFHAVTKLHQLVSLSKLRDVVRNDLFPTAEMVQSMSKEFGVPITGDDFEDSDGADVTQTLSARQASRYSFQFEVPRGRQWAPVDNYNDDFMQYLQHRDEFPLLQRDFINHNKAEVKCQSAKNHVERQKTKKATVSATVRVAHNYGTQSLNSMEQAKEKLRQILAETPDQRYTYCPTYHHSMTVVPHDVDQLKKEEQRESRRRWKTEGGWRYPGMRPGVDNNQHPLKPGQARVDELRQDWEENTLHAAVLKPTLSHRECFPWSRRHTDLDVWSRPAPVFDTDAPVTIHLAGDLRDQEQFAAAALDYRKWKQRICVDNLDMKCHRCLPATEMTDRGPRASNQLTKLEGVLKDPAKKYGIRYPGIHHCPALDVVNNPSVDIDGRRIGRVFRDADQAVDGNHGYGPGPFVDHSWLLERNVIPLRDYQHQIFAEKKGNDFNVYHKERSLLQQKRAPRPLSRHVDPDTWNLPRAESYHHQDDLEHLSPGALRFINKRLQETEA